MTTKRPAGRTLWRHADFLKLWTADTVSQLGTQITFLALPFTAISVLHANAFQVGLLSAMEFLPFILVGLPAGVWVDRLRRRPILIAGDLGRAVMLGFVPLAYGLHVLKMWQLYPVAFLTGTLPDLNLGTVNDQFNTVYLTPGGGAVVGTVAATRFESSSIREHIFRAGVNYRFSAR